MEQLHGALRAVYRQSPHDVHTSCGVSVAAPRPRLLSCRVQDLASGRCLLLKTCLLARIRPLKSGQKRYLHMANVRLLTLVVAATSCLCSALPSRLQPRAGSVRVGLHPPLDAGIPLEHFVSYSIEFSSSPDFAGNLSSPNTFSNNPSQQHTRLCGHETHCPSRWQYPGFLPL